MMRGQGERCGGVWNIQGLHRKHRDIVDWMKAKKVDWVVLTETWLLPQASTTQKPLEADKWLVSLVSEPREENARGRGKGGLALVCNPRTTRQIEVLKQSTTGFWALWKIDKLRVAGIYAPPRLDQ